MSKISLVGNNSGTGTFTLASPNSSTDRTLTLPDATGTINTSGAVNEVPAGSAAAPAIYPTGDTNTGIFFPAADTIAFAEGGAEVMRIDSSGNVCIGTTSAQLSQAGRGNITLNGSSSAIINMSVGDTNKAQFFHGGTDMFIGNQANGYLMFQTNATERARITSDGYFLVGTTGVQPGIANTGVGISLTNNNIVVSSRESGATAIFNVNVDGEVVQIRAQGTTEGTISVSGTTVSYNGGHLSRWAQMLTKPDLLKGTVMSNLDEMNVYVDADGNPVENEQLNKVKVSDVEGDANVAGVFVNWTYDEAHQVDEINMAMTGDMIIRIAQGVTVARGDLLMSAGDGTAKPQGDDIVRSKTIAKVTSTHVTCTYDDGSYCVPCVLMAC
jgi:hypothetical protein